jgi:hypothetical protein
MFSLQLSEQRTKMTFQALICEVRSCETRWRRADELAGFRPALGSASQMSPPMRAPDEQQRTERGLPYYV